VFQCFADRNSSWVSPKIFTHSMVKFPKCSTISLHRKIHSKPRALRELARTHTHTHARTHIHTLTHKRTPVEVSLTRLSKRLLHTASHHKTLHILQHTSAHCIDGVAMISRLLKITGLFCKRALYKRPYHTAHTAARCGTLHRWGGYY